MGIAIEDIDDLVLNTLSHYEKRKYTDYAQEYPEYLCARLFGADKVKQTSGKDIQFRVKVRDQDNVRLVDGTYDEDTLSRVSMFEDATVPWRHIVNGYTYDVREMAIQGDPETIIDFIEENERSAEASHVYKCEEYLWGTPASSADKKTPWGITYWVQKDATTTVEGAFNGGNPSGFSDGAGGINATTYPKARNWTAGYSSVTTNDLVRKIKKALVMTNFKPVVATPELGFGAAKRVMVAPYRVLEPMERLAETRNDNLGNDLAKYLNEIVIGGVPVILSHWLEDNDTSDPVYGLNLQHWTMYMLRGFDRVRSGPAPRASMHNVRDVFYDTTMNYACVNRRSQFVISK